MFCNFILDEQLRDLLIEEAGKRCIVDQPTYVDRPIDLAPLQMTQQQESAELSETMGHYHYRDDIPQTNKRRCYSRRYVCESL